MFTGIIQELAPLFSRKGSRLSILISRSKDKLGDSIALDGVCLTLVKKERRGHKSVLSFDVSQETDKKTSLSFMTTGQSLNIERAMGLQDALGGHIVQGHVDGTGHVEKINSKGENKVIWFKAPKDVMNYIVPKGSIAINGTSLTVNEVKKGMFSVTIIPFTLKHTNLGQLKPKSKVNLEGDIIAKYIAKYTKRK